MEEMLHRVRHALRETEEAGHTEVIMGVQPKLFSFRAEQKYVMHLRERAFQEWSTRPRIPTALEVLFMNIRQVFPEGVWPKTNPHLTLGQWNSEVSSRNRFSPPAFC